MNNKITNPVLKDLKYLKFIDEENINLFHSKTRDGEFNVLIDEVTGVIFLEQHNICEDHYIESPGAASFDDYFNCNGYFEDDLRRYEYLIPNIKQSKYLLDLGSEWGGFLKLAEKDSIRIAGAELNEVAAKYVEDTLGLKIYRDIKYVEDTPDLITMFHVLEHIPNQLEMLKIIYEKLEPGGMLVIEVPHANDFLIKEVEISEFRDFTFWNEHLILHTEESLSTFVESVGFLNCKIFNIQRYGFQNHFGWFYDKAPGGHEKHKGKFNKKLDQYYREWLINNQLSDTLICTALKPK